MNAAFRACAMANPGSLDESQHAARKRKASDSEGADGEDGAAPVSAKSARGPGKKKQRVRGYFVCCKQ